MVVGGCLESALCCVMYSWRSRKSSFYIRPERRRAAIYPCSVSYNRTLHPSLARQSHIPSLFKQNESPVKFKPVNNGSIHQASNTTLPHLSGRINERTGLVRFGHQI